MSREGKNWDASGSIGPWIVTADEVDLTEPLRIIVRLNVEVTHDDSTDHLIKSLPELIAYVSTFMTLEPGDIIATGKPVKLKRSETPQWLKADDTLEIERSAVGVLRNRVAREQ